MPTKPKKKTAASKKRTAEEVSRVSAEVGKVLGDSGTQRYNGYFFEEYNVDWLDQKRIDSVEEMRRGDAACKAAIKAIKSPLLAAKWSINTASSEKNAEEIRLCAERALFKMEGRTFDAFLREGLEYLSFGHYAFEIVWMIADDGMVTIKDLAPRIPHSINRWKLPDGRKGIVQFIRTDDFKHREAEIPMEKLVVFTNEMEGDDITGQSVLRPAWKHYYYKNNLYKIEAVSAERFGVGIPTVWMPDGSGDDEKEQAEDLAGNIRANEKGFVVMPGPKSLGWDIDIKTPNGNPQAGQITGGIQHHNKMILVAVFANFLGLDEVGSYARSSDLSSFFLHSCGDMAKYICQELGRQVIKRVVDLNYGPQDVYPTLEHSELGDIDKQALAQTYSLLTQAGLVKPNARMAKHVVDTFGLPEIPQEEFEAMQESEMEAELSKLEMGDSDGMDMPEEDAPEPDETDVAPEDEE